MNPATGTSRRRRALASGFAGAALACAGCEVPELRPPQTSHLAPLEAAPPRPAPAACGPVHVVVLGSSTAAGTGPADPANAWVERYRAYLESANAGHTLTNLARGGYNTYRILPAGLGGPDHRLQPDTTRNIERALADADAIIINLPSNDANLGIDVATQLAHYATIRARADVSGVPLWIATTQPRNFDAAKRANALAMRDSTRARFGNRSIDFFTGIARPDGTISSLYDAGDGIHLNDAGHAVLFARVAEAGVPEAASCSGRTRRSR